MVLASNAMHMWRDRLIAALVASWAFLVFSGAKDDFSYDFGNYIGYFDRLASFTLEDFWSNLEQFAPYPYIFVPPAGLFEVGFAALTWALLSTGLESATVYALLASTSIAVRIFLLRSLGMKWPLVAFISIYSITLFEANAIRLGIALTICTAALLAMVRGRGMVAGTLLALASLSHLQAAAFAIPALAWYVIAPSGTRTAVRRLALAFMVVLASIVAALSLQFLDFAKVTDYAERISGASGLNAVSVTALVLMAAGLYSFALGRWRDQAGMQDRQMTVWGASLIAALPAVTILVIATEMGAVGDRIWQFAFSMLVGCSPLMSSDHKHAGAFSVVMWVCLLISVVSITVRYPLSNFFAPLIPHTPITPFTLIT